MRRPLTSDDLDATFFPGQTPDQSRAMARQLEVWAEEPRPAGAEVNAAELLVSAGEQLLRVGDAHAAVQVLRRAVATGEPVEPDARCYLHHALLEAGDVDAARDLAERVRQERPADVDVYLLIGEDYELHGDLRAAHRWLTLGARRALDDAQEADDRTEDAKVREAAHLLRSRRRVRQQLDMPPDDWDLLVPPVDLDALPD
ncbi:tetratricopeptide repeat protein [Geodermatophilus sp. URMC 62]|uniref:tetratricopeptide repeat protein n=1 Tax=Geodermatophilus sp. URMC 62 TaxID=3423414 RepID=UPI00406C295D